MSVTTPAAVHERKHRSKDRNTCRECAEGWATCRRKRRYMSAREAHAAAVTFNVEHEWQRPLVAYRCCYCTLWHLKTAKTKAARKRATAMRRRTARHERTTR